MLDAFLRANQTKGVEQVYEILPSEVKHSSLHSTIMLKAYSLVHDVDSAYSVFKSISEPDPFAWNAIISAYATNGYLQEATALFQAAPNKLEAAPWSSMIKANVLNHRHQQAVFLFREMLHSGVAVKESVFTALLNAMTTVADLGGLLGSMQTDFEMTPSIEHWTAVVEVLGKLKEFRAAEDLIKKLPVEPNERPWMALLNACRMHGELAYGERAAAQVMKLRPTYAAPYVLLGAIYNAHNKQDKRRRLEAAMLERNIKKVPGISTIKVHDNWASFSVGFGQDPAIDKELDAMQNRLEEAGYVPSTQEVIRATAAEDNLCAHSEKVAIAYGLLKTSPGTELRVYKNLRVCKNCHASTKLISKLYCRSIILQDAVTVHHFKDGECSCQDYW